VGAELQINVSRSIFSFTLTIPRPVCIVTNYFGRTCVKKSNSFKKEMEEKIYNLNGYRKKKVVTVLQLFLEPTWWMEQPEQPM
jgi:hypothetical protein